MGIGDLAMKLNFASTALEAAFKVRCGAALLTAGCLSLGLKPAFECLGQRPTSRTRGAYGHNGIKFKVIVLCFLYRLFHSQSLAETKMKSPCGPASHAVTIERSCQNCGTVQPLFLSSVPQMQALQGGVSARRLRFYCDISMGPLLNSPPQRPTRPNYSLPRFGSVLLGTFFRL